MIAKADGHLNVVFHQGALGDFVLIWPLLRAMRRKTMVVSAWSKAKLASDVFEHVEAVGIEMLEFTRLYAAGGPTHVSPLVGDLFSQAKRIISFVSPGDDVWAENVARLASQAQHYYVRPRPAMDWTEHVCAWHEVQLERQGWSLAGKPNVLCVQRKGPIVIHPGSGSDQKNWPVERYLQLAETLREQGRDVQVVVGEVEQEHWPDDVLQQLCAQPLRCLDELVDTLHQASAYVGNDSGPTHLAAQLGLPTVALFGPSDPAAWSPVGPAVTAIAPAKPCAMAWLSVEQVFAAIP